jgi:hypothetical protein
MKNNAVLNRFGTYCGYAALASASFYGVSMVSEKYFGNSAYAIMLLFFGLAMIILWSMAKSSVESEERQKRWDAEEAQRKQSRKMLTE